jgi:hypothetical protein
LLWHLGVNLLAGFNYSSTADGAAPAGVGTAGFAFEGGFPLGRTVGRYVEPRLAMEILGRRLQEDGQTRITNVIHQVGLRFKTELPTNLHLDARIGYSVHAGPGSEVVPDGPVAVIGVGYRLWFGCSPTSGDSAFEIGVEWHKGLSDNRFDDLALVRLGGDIGFGPVRATNRVDSPQCQQRLHP